MFKGCFKFNMLYNIQQPLNLSTLKLLNPKNSSNRSPLRTTGAYV